MTLENTVPLGSVEPPEENGNGNGHVPESEEQLDGVLKRLQNIKRGDGAVVSMTKQELGLLQTILRSASESYREETFWRIVDFMDSDEAFDHVAAFYEAKDLGMDTTFNVSLVFALCSVNHKGGHNNLYSLVMDTMQFGQHARANQPRGKDASKNPRSPLA